MAEHGRQVVLDNHSSKHSLKPVEFVLCQDLCQLAFNLIKADLFYDTGSYNLIEKTVP